MPNREEILKALQVIKSTCEEQEHCETCPLLVSDKVYSSERTCAMQSNESPCDWKIKAHETVWRAFEDKAVEL